MRRDITFLALGGGSLLLSFFAPAALPVNPAWLAILLCGAPIVREAAVGLFTRFDIKADVLVSLALLASVAIGEIFAAGEIAFIMQLGSLLEERTVAKARAGIEKLVRLTPRTARRVTAAGEESIPAEAVAVGDRLRVLPGETIPVDGVVRAGQTSVNQAVMTGESLPVDKGPGDEVFSGTVNQFGSFEMEAARVGEDSSIQRMIRLVQSADAGKAKIVGLADRWATWIVVAALASAALTWLLSGQVIRAVTILVVFCPCALVLATPTAIMAAIGNATRHSFLVREGDALERLAQVGKAAFDKTGTLTQNKMTPQKVYADGSLLEGEDLSLVNDVQRLLLKAALLASDATNNEKEGTAIGDPTEVALVMLGEKFGVDEESYRAQHPRLGELAFDSDRKLMSTLHDIDGVPTLFTKGAIDVLLNRSTHLLTREGKVEMTPERREELARVNMELSMEGLRVLAFAYKELDAVRPLTLEDENGFTFIGLISMIDPPRPEAVQAVADAKRGGIRTIMITGDHKVTASAIARQLGIFRDGDEAVSGVELDGMTDTELDERLPRISVYARVSPEHKIRIVNAWQRRGNIVSMTGDGVNDAPALKKADIGVAMGITGTEVSKDAASMILADDNFATIVKAVVNGRSVYANIKNAIQFLLSGNTAGIFCVLYASLLALPVPFQPVHLLFINLLTDSLPAIAIGMEPARKGLLDQKPRDPREPILNRPLLARIGGQGLLIAIVTMIAFYLGYQGGDAVMASTMAFATLTLARLFHGFNCRGSESIFRLKLSTNKYSVLAFLAGVVLLLLVLFTPGLKSLFMVAPAFGFANLGEIVLLAFLPTLVIQLVKLVCDARRGK